MCCVALYASVLERRSAHKRLLLQYYFSYMDVPANANMRPRTNTWAISIAEYMSFIETNTALQDNVDAARVDPRKVYDFALCLR